MEIPEIEAREAAPPPQSQGPPMRRVPPPEFPRKLEQRQKSEDQGEKQTGLSREVRWLIAVEGDSPLKLIVSSQKGGTRLKNLEVQ